MKSTKFEVLEERAAVLERRVDRLARAISKANNKEEERELAVAKRNRGLKLASIPMIYVALIAVLTHTFCGELDPIEGVALAHAVLLAILTVAGLGYAAIWEAIEYYNG